MATQESKPSTSPITPKYLHEYEEISQQCKDLIATLPMEAGFSNIQIHLYNGFWIPTRELQGTLYCQNHFQSHDSDIFLVTSPKSGTTWLKSLVFAIINRESQYPNPCSDQTQTHYPHPLLTTNSHDLVPFLEYYTTTTTNMSTSPSPRVFSSHLPYVLLPKSVKTSRCKIVYLCRNPKDLFVSMWHFANNLTGRKVSIEDCFEKFCQGRVGYGPFWDHFTGYYKESLGLPDKVMFLRFEELKEEPIKVLKNLAEFIGYGFTENEENGCVIENILDLCSIDNLKSLEVNKSGKVSFGIENKNFFRRGEVGDFKNYLTSDMINRLNLISQEKLEKHGLKF